MKPNIPVKIILDVTNLNVKVDDISAIAGFFGDADFNDLIANLKAMLEAHSNIVFKVGTLLKRYDNLIATFQRAENKQKELKILMALKTLLSNENPLIIDPANLKNDKEKTLLFDMLKADREQPNDFKIKVFGVNNTFLYKGRFIKFEKNIAKVNVVTNEKKTKRNWIGEKIYEYIVYDKERKIGKGSYGTVTMVAGELIETNLIFKKMEYRPYQKKSVLKGIKSLTASVSEDNLKNHEEYKANIKHEALINSIVHESLGSTQSFFVGGWPKKKGYIKQPQIEGIPLDTIVFSMLSFKEKLIIAYQLLLAVEAVHSKGIVHRDIKPENAIIDTKTMQINLVDFGGARLIKDKFKQKSISGTPEMMGPEFFSSDAGDAGFASDVYAYGQTLKKLFGDEEIEKLIDELKNADDLMIKLKQTKEAEMLNPHVKITITDEDDAIPLIINLLRILTEPDPRGRINLDVAKSLLKAIAESKNIDLDHKYSLDEKVIFTNALQSSSFDFDMMVKQEADNEESAPLKIKNNKLT